MALYRDRILPRLIDKACGSADLVPWRVKCLDGLHGTVVEPGFGSGSNLGHYPDEVERVYAVDPATLGQDLAKDRIAASTVEVEFVGLDGQEIPLDDDTCDGGVLTFSLCTIADPVAALRELRRVIKPGGTLHYLEHGRGPTDSMITWQRRIDPVQKRLFDGCHVSRDHPRLIAEAGFESDWHEESYGKGPKPWSYFHIGRAINPA